MRELFLVPLVLLLFAGLSGDPALAEGPDAKVPDYSIEYLMPDGESELEGDWKVKDTKAPANAPTEAALTKIAESLGLNDDNFYVETAVLTKGSDVVALAMVDVDEKVEPFHAALKAQAETHGWRSRELGSASRLLIVGGSAGALDAAAQAAAGHAIYAFGSMAMRRLNPPGNKEKSARDIATVYMEAVNAIHPDTGIASVIAGRLKQIHANWDLIIGKQGAEVDKTLNMEAAELYAKSLDDGVAYPPKKGILLFAAWHAASIFLTSKEKSRIPAATRILELAVANEKDQRDQGNRYNCRYNLACAYALGDQKEKALAMLRRAFEAMKSLPGDSPRQCWEHAEVDKDFASIRGDPRWSKILHDAEPQKPKGYDERKAHREKLKRIHDEAVRKAREKKKGG